MDNFKRELRTVRRFEASYYKQLLETIEQYVDEKPDITIETCKAIIEGLSKLILGELNQTPDSYFKNNDLTLSRLFKEARNCLKEKIDEDQSIVVYDDKIIGEYGGLANILGQLMPAEVVAQIGRLRNDHGDISHGRSPLKKQINDEDLAELIVGLTDHICTYLLRKLNQLTADVLHYEDNPEFNKNLDEINPLPGNILYSKALFEQELESYEIELGDYIIESCPEE